MQDITGIIVSYNTRNLLRDCVSSIRKFHPLMPLIIIDGSSPMNACYSYAKTLRNSSTTVMSLNKNIGHGEGMLYGIFQCKTKYFLLIDSDTVIKSDPLPEMVNMIGDNYGIGQVVRVDKNGINQEGGIKYLHPHFALINKEQYVKYDSIIHHGAPMLRSMIDIAKRNHANKLIDFPVQKYIHHIGRGTRVLNPKGFNSNTWDKIA